MPESQDAQAGHRANELSQEDWDFLLRLQVETCAHAPIYVGPCRTLHTLCPLALQYLDQAEGYLCMPHIQCSAT